MTQRQFDNRVKGINARSRRRPKVRAGASRRRSFLEIAAFLLCCAFAVGLATNVGDLGSVNRPSRATEAAASAFGATSTGAAHAGQSVAQNPPSTSISALDTFADVSARGWDQAITWIRATTDSFASGDLQTIAYQAMDQFMFATQRLSERIQEMMPSSSSAGAPDALGLNASLPLFAEVIAVSLLIGLCFGAASVVTARVARVARWRGYRHGVR